MRTYFCWCHDENVEKCPAHTHKSRPISVKAIFYAKMLISQMFGVVERPSIKPYIHIDKIQIAANASELN
jgi:hypothetical protein